MSWLRLSYGISSWEASPQGGAQALAWCPPTCDTGDERVGFWLTYLRGRTYKLPGRRGIVVPQGAISDPLKIPVWTLNAGASSHMETRVWKPNPKEWRCSCPGYSSCPVCGLIPHDIAARGDPWTGPLQHLTCMNRFCIHLVKKEH